VHLHTEREEVRGEEEEYEGDEDLHGLFGWMPYAPAVTYKCQD